MTVIDVHAHVFPRISREEGRILAGAGEPWLREGMMMSGEEDYRPVTPELWDAGARLEAMDRSGVDVQAVSSTPLLFGYAAEAERAADWCEMVNDRILAYCSQEPDRLLPLCQVPLQDLSLAVTAVTKAKAAGHRGVHIGNHVGPRDLDDPEIVEFLTHCADEDMPVLVHPWDMLAADRMGRYMLPWLVGMGAETQLGILSLMLSGAFERLPSSLRLCFCHGGGSFAFLLGRADNAWRNRDIVRKDSPKPPSAYTDRFHVDSAVFDPRALRLLIDVMGVERVMLGTDFPFPLGEQEPGTVVRDCPGLDEADRAAILGGNAARFLGLGA
ncbi:aminocarboxymuconate-semialdehyde decarboxylase [Streptosporangium becharense]|uniref:2-amino-3-carboxymuconate-6-semialdehyde decarboxylase n=1 Tax=Streptosporangium becharense TaxID=1816182 RepID=A0A7W9MJ88_9ACTN|nr:amidohydrolase family protein [Streptosporangium becharense]MBB2913271.1 aminocarboxymuconate-semialdehyde decarboxylase [Streptosporangium becharense]MBB5822254.1 aminocarboxymuconate-semialdehyde decarboxylase [Streptosporangium becharense]